MENTKLIYRVITIEGNSVTHVEAFFCSTKEKALELIDKDVKRHELCGAVVEDYKNHKWQNVAIKDGCSKEGWVTATMVKTVTAQTGGKAVLGFVSYALV